MVIKLRIAEAFRNDVGRGMVRVDGKVLEELNQPSGGAVEILGKKKTVAILWRGHPNDEGLGMIRMDGFTRHNCGVALGDTVMIRRVMPKDAGAIEFAPTETVRISGNFSQYLKHRLMNRVLMQGDRIVVGVLGSSIPFIVKSTEPGDAVAIREFTQISVQGKPVVPQYKMPKISYEDIGGLGKEIQKIREMVELPMKHPELFKKLGIEPPKGILLYGPPGTGKTLLAKAVASEIEANFIVINGPEVVSKWYGSSEENLRRVFKEAQDKCPSIIFIDEIDSIAPKRSEVQGEVEKRIVAQLLTLMDGLEARGNVIVIGATNREDGIDMALRRPGRFDREISVGAPDKEGRKEVLQIHTRNMPLAKNISLDEISSSTHGFVGADLAALAKEAAFGVLRRNLPKMDLEKDEIPEEVLEKLLVTKSDFVEALKNVGPSAMRELMVEIPNVGWADVGGLEEIKESMVKIVEKPIKKPEVFKRMGIKPTKGVLLYGPPGCGKTLLAKAVAGESECNFISVRGPELLSMWVGESEKAIREVFKKARQVSPCIIFFDEIDAIAGRRGEDTSRASDRVLNQILTEMDGIEKLENVIVMAATNRPDLVDPAIMRPGRFDQIVLVGPPDAKARKEIFKVHTKPMPIGKLDLEMLIAATEGYTGADIESLCREAAYLAMDRDSKSVSQDDFERALEKVKPSVGEGDLDAYEKYMEMSKGACAGGEPSYA
jgi:transitional endoplasmic reticulum ATPase